MKKPSFKIGDKVFAKVKGYPPWPAKIIAENGKKYNVEFYGTGETGVIKIEDLFYFKKNKQKFQRPLKRKDYLDAFEQIEEAIAEDGGDGDEHPDVNDSILDKSSSSLNSSTASVNTSVKERKPVKRERTSSIKSESTPAKKSLRLTKSDEAKSEDVVTEEKEPIVTPAKKTPKATKPKKEKEIKVESTPKAKEKEPVSEKVDVKTDKEKVEKEPVKQETKETSLKEESSPDDKIEIVSEQYLKYNIIYGKHVKEKKSLYQDRPVEPRPAHAGQVLPVRLPSGAMGGVKVHVDRPAAFAGEYEAAVYDEAAAQQALDLKAKLQAGEAKIEDEPARCVGDIGMTEEQVKQRGIAEEVRSRSARVARLKREAELVSLDGKIKNCLGLDKADPREAIAHLEQMRAIEIDDVMLKKHMHIVEMMRRLRKYVGNTKEWNMSGESLTEFSSQAEKVRAKAEDVYAKFKKVVKLPENCTSFFEGFTELVSQFRAACKELNLTDTEVFVLCGEPMSRQSFLDRLDEKESEETSTEEAPLNGAEELPAGGS